MGFQPAFTTIRTCSVFVRSASSQLLIFPTLFHTTLLFYLCFWTSCAPKGQPLHSPVATPWVLCDYELFALKGQKSYIPILLLPFQGVRCVITHLPRALPWSKESIGLSARLYNVVGFPNLGNVMDSAFAHRHWAFSPPFGYHWHIIIWYIVLATCFELRK